MNAYDAQEQAYKNGEKRGYENGFADGLAAAGIAPIQWRDAREVPFHPADG